MPKDFTETLVTALEVARAYIRGMAWGSTEAYETVEIIDEALSKVQRTE